MSPERAKEILESLTPRERLCALLLSRRARNWEIENHMDLSPSVLEKLVTQLFDKIGCETRAQLRILIARSPELSSGLEDRS